MAICLFAGHLVLLAMTPGINVVSMPFLYAAVLGLYMIGPYILYLSLGPLGLVYFRIIDYGYLTGCLPLIMLAIAGFTLGAFGAMAWRGPKKDMYAQRNRIISQHSARQRLEVMTAVIALSLIVFSLLIIAAETAAGRGLAPMISGNYHVYSDARKDGNQSRLFIAAMTWFLPIGSLTYNAVRKHRLRRVGSSDVLLMALLAIPLIAGDRGGLLATLAGWFIIHQSICRNIGPGKLLLAAATILVFVPLLEVMRNLSVADWSLSVMLETVSNLSSSSDKFGGSTLLSLLGPFSPALMTFMGTLMRVEGGETLRLGTDYIGTMLAAIPLNSGTAPNNSGQIHDYLIPGRKGGPGFMAIAEMYINFHVPGVAAGHVLLGYVTTRLHRTLSDTRTSAHALAFAGVLFFALLIWVRNEFTFVTQICFLWGVLFMVFPFIARSLVPWRKVPRRRLSDT
ncbi:O-antigen polysaccharide polymerase Wzy [Roseovarius tibetensis]|uniref:O-antigen polysaccharide polymerase Wzy n=1 Tax=Roseovarius tibetensis TaxID=2685897 RepID=UPI003D7FC18F